MPAKSRAQPKILVVEDEAIVALDIERGLKRLGYDVVGVLSSGEEAISMARKKAPDLILMDIQLKGKMNGIQAASEIRQRNKIPIVFLTAYADEATLQRAKEAEPYGYILKPFEETELRTAIEVVLKKHHAVSKEELRTQGELVLSETRFQLFAETVRDYAIVMLDPAGNIMSWNAGAERITGFHASDVVGKNFSIFYSPEEISRKRPETVLGIAAAMGRHNEEGWRFRKDHSKYWADVVIAPLRDHSGALIGFGSVVRDLTEKKKEIEVLERNQELLRKALGARDEFLSIASHELKTPLTTLILQLEILRREVEKASTLSSPMTRIEDRLALCTKYAKSLDVLVENLLDLTRLRTGQLYLEPTQVNLTEVAREVVEKLRHATSAKNRIEVKNREGEVFGTWDRGRTEQLISNLLSNAIKYGEGKPIEIEIFLCDSRTACLVIHDNGIGIPEEMQQRVFERFERAIGPSNVTGLGLGLYLTQHIVRAQGGTISLESQIGQGTTVTVKLPLRPAEMAA